MSTITLAYTESNPVTSNRDVRPDAAEPAAAPGAAMAHAATSQVTRLATPTTIPCTYRHKQIQAVNGTGACLINVLDKLGTGAYGSVFKAEDMESGTQVAVKILSPDIVLKRHQYCSINYSSHMIRPGVSLADGETPTREHVFWLRVGNDLVAALAVDREPGVMREATLQQCVQIFGTRLPSDEMDADNAISAGEADGNDGGSAGEFDTSTGLPTTYEKFLSKRARKLGEVAAMQALHPVCPGVLRCLKVFEHVQEWRTTILIVTDLARGGDLFDYVVTEGKGGSDKQKVKAILRQLVRVIAAAHRHRIAHRDIKLDNMLFLGRDSSSQVAIADWGLADQLDADTDTIISRNGTPGYWAPEIWEDRKAPFCPFKADAWAIGASAYCLLKGHPAFNQHPWKCRRMKLYAKWQREHDTITDAPQWLMPSGIIDGETREFLCSLLCLDPAKRLSVLDLLQHPWLEFEPEQTPEQADPLSSMSVDSEFSVALDEYCMSESTEIESLYASSFDGSESESKVASPGGAVAQRTTSTGKNRMLTSQQEDKCIDVTDLQSCVYRSFGPDAGMADAADPGVVPSDIDAPEWRANALRDPMTSNESIASVVS